MSSAVSIVNKKALHDYEVLETFEAGIVLQGGEVKSIRKGSVNLKGNFVLEWKGELFVENMHISPFQFSSIDIAPLRKRKLLLHKREILKIIKAIDQKGVTCCVLEIFLKGNLVKAKVGIVKGKKLHDKRETLKRKDQDMEMRRAVKRFK